MLSDIVIRLIAAIGLITLVNANDITTSSVVMSICILFLLEISILVKNRILYHLFTILPFVASFIFILITKPTNVIVFEIILLVLAAFAGCASYLYSKMASYKDGLIKTRDDSKELEYILKGKNRQLLKEQDQQVHLATLAERNRIAREIHDNVGHLLSRAILLLGAITTVNKDEAIAPKLKILSDTLDESMEKMRSSVHNLHDDSIDLNKNFEEIIGELKNFTVNTELDLEENIPKNIKLTLIGILKEAVTNIIKHSNGNMVSVILHKNYRFCTLSVHDNGTLSEEAKTMIAADGFEGIGLRNIKTRATSIGGDAYFYTNDGFTVFARLPFDKNLKEQE
ncbi:MAG: two-component sensor histidine kinase [Pseudobutyrivibrio sp.]|nr:two-component sensor histidine kinase [Pseudobutyrivibrio sp.]